MVDSNFHIMLLESQSPVYVLPRLFARDVSYKTNTCTRIDDIKRLLTFSHIECASAWSHDQVSHTGSARRAAYMLNHLLS